MLEFLSNLDLGLAFSLVLALAFVLSFEFINGFHDTANAVATVIYTKAMPPYFAVVASGIFNFLGVLLGGLGVAYTVVHLLPVDLLLNVTSVHGLVMIFSLLTAALLWNLGTWYWGLPISSSHTLIGSILGVGLANALISHTPLGQSVNWNKAIEVVLSLIISPVIGFLIAAVLLLYFKRYRAHSRMHKTPEERLKLDGKKHPPFWSRVVLIGSAMGVSFFHGANDGQKGIGLLMLVLIGIVPNQFALNASSSAYEIQRTRDAAIHMEQVYQRNADNLKIYPYPAKGGDTALPRLFECNPQIAVLAIGELSHALDQVTHYALLDEATRRQTRRLLLCIDDIANKMSKNPYLSPHDRKDIATLRKDLTTTTEYAPQWVIIAVALALGAGTMIGWKRVVKTVGEKIGQKGITYAQGAAAQATATLSIGLATWIGMPVSTTHVLSSGIAGTVVADSGRLQASTVRKILLAWVLTLPAAILLSAGLFWIGELVI